jgi:GntR family histidine utilization transcriptional repressor
MEGNIDKAARPPTVPDGSQGSGVVHLHQKIRSDIEGRIMSGEWAPGHRLPYEHELMDEYGCSRMTVNKVLSALAAQGLITRRRRAGSVVAAPSSDRAVLEIQDFALEAKRANKTYRHEILRRAVDAVDAATAARIGMPTGSKMLCLDTLHLVEGEPEAYEERIINLDSVPEARAEHFDDVPPGTWLLNRVPWTDAEHIIRAVNADAKLHRRLQVATGAACLVLERRTWQAGIFLTEARIAYPGERHRLIGRFSPVGNGQFPPSLKGEPDSR